LAGLTEEPMAQKRRKARESLKPGTPIRLSYRPVRDVLCAFVLFFLVALVGCGGGSSFEEAPAEKGKEGTTEEVERLAVRDAVGQMFVVGMGGTEPDYYIEKMIRERNIGGVLLFGYNMESEEQTKELIDSLQSLSMTTEPAIPLFVAVDHEGGEVQSTPWVSEQPSAAEVGGRADPEEARRIAERIGSELRRGGVNTNLAPVVDTGFGAAIESRSYGDDPVLVGRMGAAAVRGFEEAGVVSAAKHFPNHGPALEDSHTGRPRIDHDMQTLLQRDLPPFRTAIEAGVPMVMVGHLVYPAIDSGQPTSLSPAAIQLLRGELGFDGVIVTDDLAMEGAMRGGTAAQAAVAAVAAGADLLIISSLPEEQAAAYDAVVAAVESGEIPREQIDVSVQRIKNIKNRYPLYSGG
jgi:beta-N-acetylhexosaminidase